MCLQLLRGLLRLRCGGFIRLLVSGKRRRVERPAGPTIAAAAAAAAVVVVVVASGGVASIASRSVLVTCGGARGDSCPAYAEQHVAAARAAPTHARWCTCVHADVLRVRAIL